MLPFPFPLLGSFSLFLGPDSAPDSSSAAKDGDLADRLKSINSHFLYSLYCNVCRSLLEKDKLLFSFIVTTKLMAAGGLLHGDEHRFLLTGGVVLEDPPPKPMHAEWITEKAWGEIHRLSALPR